MKLISNFRLNSPINIPKFIIFLNKEFKLSLIIIFIN